MQRQRHLPNTKIRRTIRDARRSRQLQQLIDRAKATTAPEQLNNQHENNDNDKGGQQSAFQPEAKQQHVVKTPAMRLQISIINLNKHQTRSHHRTAPNNHMCINSTVTWIMMAQCTTLPQTQTQH
jgi:hypothetical protein